MKDDKDFPSCVRLSALGKKNYFRHSDIQRYVRNLKSIKSDAVDEPVDVKAKVKNAMKKKAMYVTKTV